jgi:peptidoglycan/xylan/chitin deacetylase (PgdA/CDA1 family)
MGGVRWLVKKAARHAVAFGSVATGALALRDRLAGAPCIRAITYHRFGDAPGDVWCVAARDFAAQMQWLAAERRAISLDDVCAFVAGAKELPRDAVLVTIDDGCRSTHDLALPILRDAGVPAVAFVSAGLVGAGAVASDHGEAYCGWDALARLAEAGVEIGSHAFDHRSLGRMGAAEARDQAERSRAVIADRLGVAPRSFAYPFGTRADYAPATDRMLAEVGYQVAFTAVHGAIRRGAPAISLPRVKIEGGESQAMFQLSCRGAMDAWQWVDELVPRLARARSETRAG